MKIRNVKVPEGINVSRHSPLADLLILGGGLIAIVAGAGLVLFLFAGALARHAPVSWEVAAGDAVFAEAGAAHDAEARAVEAELQALADRLAPLMDLPEGLAVTLHYVDEPLVNAFASLGGHVFVYRGLLARMPSENALAMVLAHEIGHVAGRDAAAAMTGGIAVQLVTAVVLGAAPDSVEALLTGPNALLLLGFSREAERRADRAALVAVGTHYGHVADAAKVFQIFLEEAAAASRAEPLRLLSTHPLSRDRIAAQRALARARGWRDDGPTGALPPAIAALSGGDRGAK